MNTEMDICGAGCAGSLPIKSMLAQKGISGVYRIPKRISTCRSMTSGPAITASLSPAPQQTVRCLYRVQLCRQTKRRILAREHLFRCRHLRMAQLRSRAKRCPMRRHLRHDRHGPREPSMCRKENTNTSLPAHYRIRTKPRFAYLHVEIQFIYLCGLTHI